MVGEKLGVTNGDSAEIMTKLEELCEDRTNNE